MAEIVNELTERGEWIVSNQMELPDSLTGKKVLEYYSRVDSLKDAIERRGGLCFSVDNKDSSNEKDVVLEIENTLPFEDNTFDYIIMRDPDIISELDGSLNNNFTYMILEFSRVLKEEGESKIIVMENISSGNMMAIVDMLNEELREISKFYTIVFKRIKDNIELEPNTNAIQGYLEYYQLILTRR